MKIRFLIALLITFSLSSCSKLAEKSLKDEVVEFFAQQGVIDFDIECHRPAYITRVGSCVFLGSPESVERLVTRLNLKDFEAKDTEINYKMYWEIYRSSLDRGDYEKYQCYSIPAFHDLKTLKVYGAINRPPELNLGSGSQFENFLLFYRTDNDEVCIEISYAFG